LSQSVTLALAMGAAFCQAPEGSAPARSGKSQSPASSPVTAGKADRVYRNSVIFTSDAGNPRAEAIAIREGRIIYVGAARGLAPYIGEKTAVVDLHGRFLMPGLVDGHMHPFMAGAQLLKCNLNYESLTVPNSNSGFRCASIRPRPRSPTLGSRSSTGSRKPCARPGSRLAAPLSMRCGPNGRS
jgi:hypothetical protein